jgi:polar amino acid transport system substrate-binding protein
MRIKQSAVFAVVCLGLGGAAAASAGTMDRIKETGHIKLGYLPDARPFTYKNDAGTADGYGVALCQAIAGQVKAQLALPALTVDWVPLTLENRLSEVQQGNVDLLCTPTTVTLTRRKAVAFSIPVFAGGNRAVLRADASSRLRDVLAETPNEQAVWRGSPAAKLLEGTSFAVVSGTSTETWLNARRAAFQINAKITPVPDYRTGLQLLLDRKVNVFFGERSLVLGAMDAAAREKLTVLDRLFTHELAGLAFARSDEDFHLLVDASLSQLYASKEFAALYAKWFGPFPDKERDFLLWYTLGQ